MCGIAGIVRLDGTPVDPGALDRLTDALAHRGPDGRGVFLEHGLGLGHRRLSILDLSEAAAQPMQSEDGSVVLTFNGEIYNFAEQRSHLESLGCRFRSTGDTEVLLQLYRVYGTACLKRLRGMFSFAVYDRDKRTLFLARDRAGKKPLKYFLENGVFAFASELKALRTLPECPRAVDFESIHHYLTMMYVPSPATGFTGVHKLPAAHFLLLDLKTGHLHTERYWSLERRAEPLPADARGRAAAVADWKGRIVSAFDESVRLRMVADVPVGAFLSGGVDSAAVTAFMGRHSTRPVRTFSVGTEDPSFNELPEAELTARRLGTEHHPILVRPDIVELLPDLVSTYEEPFADVSSIPTFLLSRETRKEVTVALNGDGGDENFAGYVRYPILLFSQRWQRVPALLHALMRRGTAGLHAARRNTFSYRCKRFEHSLPLPWEERYLQYLSFFTEEEKRALYRDGFAADFPRTDGWYARRTAHARAHADNMLHQAMNMDFETYLADDLLPKVDLGSMAWGLEARSPFLDHVFLELTARLPSALQLKSRTRKWILKEVLRDLVPPEILGRRKTGFRLPLNRWFRGPLRGFVHDRLLGAPGPFWHVFDRERIEKFLERDYFSTQIDYSDHVWSLLWLSEWFGLYT